MSPRSRMGELEQAVLEALWDLDDAESRGESREESREESRGASGREVHDRLDGRDLAYTTVMTVLDRLVGKDVVVRERDGRAFRYTARRTRAAMTADLMREALEVNGADRDQALVSFVGEASPEDLAALRRALADLA